MGRDSGEKHELEEHGYSKGFCPVLYVKGFTPKQEGDRQLLMGIFSLLEFIIACVFYLWMRRRKIMARKGYILRIKV